MSETKTEFRHIVRVANTDLSGNTPIAHALKKIKGIGFCFANAICHFTNIPNNKITGNLTDEEIRTLNDLLKNPAKYDIPIWLMNRRSDPEFGINSHVSGSDLKFQTENDIKNLKKIRCYKGIRHGLGLPVRGQSTKANFRKKKGIATGVKSKGGAASAVQSKPGKDKPGKEKGGKEKGGKDKKD